MVRSSRFSIACLLLLLFSAACTSQEPEGRAIPKPTRRPKAATSVKRLNEPTVKLGFHYRPLKDDTDVSVLAAQTSFVILTKTDEEYRDQLRRAGYTGLILQYIRGSEIDGPLATNAAESCDESHKPWPNQVGDRQGDFCTLVHPHEDWFLHNSSGERLYNANNDYGERYFYHMNPGSEGWRAFVLDQLKRMQFGDATSPPLGYDGIFLDNIELTMYKDLYQLTNSDGAIQEYDSDAAYREAWRGWLEYIRNGLGTTVPIWGNMVAGGHSADEWNIYMPYLDGGMDEAFVTGYFNKLGVQEQNNALQQAEQVLGQGKGFYAVSQGDAEDTSRQQFALAAYLLIVEQSQHSYFRYTRADDGYGEWWMYDNYSIRLGNPLGPRYAIANGWRRDFEKGYVTIDQVKQKGSIVERESADVAR